MLTWPFAAICSNDSPTTRSYVCRHYWAHPLFSLRRIELPLRLRTVYSLWLVSAALRSILWLRKMFQLFSRFCKFQSPKANSYSFDTFQDRSGSEHLHSCHSVPSCWTRWNMWRQMFHGEMIILDLKVQCLIHLLRLFQAIAAAENTQGTEWNEWHQRKERTHEWLHGTSKSLWSSNELSGVQ